MVADIARNIREVVLSNVTDLTKRALWSSVAVLGAPLFFGGYLMSSLGIPPQTAHAETVEVVDLAIGLCDQHPVNDGNSDQCARAPR